MDRRLAFDEHLSEKISKANRGICAIKRLYNSLPRKSLLSIFQSFVRPHLDYADVAYNQPFNSSFCQKIESIQYNACLAITGAIKGTSREKIYHELGIESLRERRWLWRLCLFLKIVKGFAPAYLSNYLPNFQMSYKPARQNLFACFCSNTSYFSGTFSILCY